MRESGDVRIEEVYILRMLDRNYKGPSKSMCLRQENFVLDKPWIKDWQEM